MNKGFTLVELIAVIVILALLVIITTPAYDSVSTNIKTRNYESKKSSIKAQTLSYVEKYMKNDVYDGTKGVAEETSDRFYIKINESDASKTLMEISKAICFTPTYLIQNGIISSDSDIEEYIKNDVTNEEYTGTSDTYIKIYYNIRTLKLNSMIIGEKNKIPYNTNKEKEVKFEEIECSKKM